MNDDYLWDRSGPPDPEIERLERALAPLRYRHRPGLVRGAASRSRTWWGAIAAAVLVAAAVRQLEVSPAAATPWQVAGLEGAARLGNRSAAVSMAVSAGQVVRTESGSQLTLQADDVGRVDLGPDSELRAAATRLQLNRGVLHAFIWAPPRQFVLDTPSARAVDLGCEYTISVDGAGNGRLRVALGWVAFQHGGREAFIPAGAECLTRERQGPGIPFYEDAPPPLRQALADFENGDVRALGGILQAARPRDALTLWHLLTRVAPPEVPAVFERFAQLVPLPAGVSREGIQRRDPRMIDLCWDALGLESTSWWRGWERNW